MSEAEVNVRNEHVIDGFMKEKEACDIERLRLISSVSVISIRGTF